MLYEWPSTRNFRWTSDGTAHQTSGESVQIDYLHAERLYEVRMPRGHLLRFLLSGQLELHWANGDQTLVLPDNERRELFSPEQPNFCMQPRATYEVSPYQPLPPPAHPVYENPNARTHLLEPNKELKLFPPVVPGQSTLSLHGKSNTFVASPYNTLRAISMQRSPSHSVMVLRSASADPPFSLTAGHSSPQRTRRCRANSSQSVAKSSSADEPWEIKTVVKTTTIRRESTGSSGGGDGTVTGRGGAGGDAGGGGAQSGACLIEGMMVMAYR